MIRSMDDFRSLCKKKILQFSGFTKVQEETFANPDFWNTNRSLFLTAATASGKTLIAYAAMAQIRKERALKSLYIVPFRSLAYQKYEEIVDFFSDSDAPGFDKEKIYCSTSEYSSDDDSIQNGKAQIAVTIYEKLFLFINHDPEFLRSYDVVVLDEFGIVSNPERGLKADFIFMSCLAEADIRLITLSTPFFQWDEYLSCGRGNFIQVCDKERPYHLTYIDCISKPWQQYLPEDRPDWFDHNWVNDYEDLIAGICAIEYWKEHSVLIFCKNRERIRKLVYKIYKFFLKHYPFPEEPLDRRKAETLFDEIYKSIGCSYGDLFGVFEADENRDAQLVGNLKAAFLNGITFHNASLPYQLRSEIENRLINTGELRIVAATDTLAYGINSTVSTVLIDCRQDSDVEMTQYEYLNYCGRAGRYGAGTVYTFYRDQQHYERMQQIIHGDIQRITSNFCNEGREDRALYLLTQIGMGRGSKESLCEYIKRMPNGAAADDANVREIVDACLDQLIDQDLVQYGRERGGVKPLECTPMGNMVRGYIVSFSDFQEMLDYVQNFENEQPFSIFDFLTLVVHLKGFRDNSYFASTDHFVMGPVFQKIRELSGTPLISETFSRLAERFCSVRKTNGVLQGYLTNDENFPYTFGELRQSLLLTRMMCGDDAETLYRIGHIPAAILQSMLSCYSYYIDIIRNLALFYQKNKLLRQLTALTIGLKIGGVPNRLILALDEEQSRRITASDSEMLKRMYRFLILFNRTSLNQDEQRTLQRMRSNIEKTANPFQIEIWQTLLLENHENPIT